MTSLAERFAPSAEPELPAVTPPPSFSPSIPGASNIPWWTGVPGLDLEVRVREDEWLLACEFSAMTCAAQVLGADAGRTDILRGQRSAPARRWLTFLLEGQPGPDMQRRILALRLICERAAVIADDHILQAAQQLYTATTARR